MPVTSLTLDQARQACAFEHKRLPSSSQWGAAARGARNFSRPRRSEDTGPMSPSLAQTHFYSSKTIHAVGADFWDISGSGARDMGGNVAEFTAQTIGTAWLTCGGSFAVPNPEFATASRVINQAAPDVGCRCITEARW